MSSVYFIDAKAGAGRSILRKFADLLDRCLAGGPFHKGERVAVKCHFGEMGNTSYLEASFARTLVGKLKDLGAEPFLTDTNTLYRGGRARTEKHLATARAHGFSEESIGAPVVISDTFETVEAGAGLGKVKVAGPVRRADGLVLLTHVTGHMLYGLGGAVKNLAMGCSSPAGKQVLHSDLTPEVNREKCSGCGTCVDYCPVDAIALVEGKARIDGVRCIGCGECVTVCPEGAIPPVWKGDPRRIAEKTAAFGKAVLSNKRGKALFVNCLLSITPDCDCCDWNEQPIVPDIGILASRDIVAADQATIDLVAGAPIVPGSALEERIEKKVPPWSMMRKALAPLLSVQPKVRDKFGLLHGVDSGMFLDEAERFGLGSRRYTLREVPAPPK